MPELLFACPQNRESFTKSEVGHFCSTCSHPVIDFTHFSPDQIQDYFKNHPGKVCGTFRKEQLYKPEQSILTSIFRYAFALVFVLGLNAADLYAQESRDSTLNRSAIQDTVVTFSGRIIDQNGEPLPFAKILLSVDSVLVVATMSNSEGQYKLQIPKRKITGHVLLTARMVGHHSLEYKFVTIDQLNYSLDLTLTAVTQEFVTGIILHEQYFLNKDPANSGRIRITGDDLKYRQR